MNTVIYARYSSHNQTEQSIEGQLQACYEYAQRNGYTVIGEYIDRAQSGTSDNRVDFQRMIADSDRPITIDDILLDEIEAYFKAEVLSHAGCSALVADAPPSSGGRSAATKLSGIQFPAKR